MAIRDSRLLFFQTSQALFTSLSALFDFIWPTAAAMWNLRWQVRGYVAVNPEASVEELDGRFVAGSGIRGANLRRACVEHSWEQQQEEFAKLLLINAIALFESWVRDILKSLGSPSMQLEKHLQNPTRVKQGKREGVWHAVEVLTATESSLICRSFYPSLLTHGKNSRQHLDELLTLYRFFKECRNCLMHNGGLADQKACIAYNEFAAVATVGRLGLKEVPLHAQLSPGQSITIFLRGVVGLCDVIMRIVATLDAEFARSEQAELEIYRRWIAKYGGRKNTLKTTDLDRRKRQTEKLMTKLGFPAPKEAEEIAGFLRVKQLIG